MVAKSKASSPPATMHIVQHRTQTFSRAVKVNSKSKLRWPHTHPIPEDLAFAGFYYLPYEGADDNVCCYLCEKNMGGWEETDDPLKEHLRGNKSCAWAVLRDLLVRSKNGEEFGDNVEDPRSEKMNKLREATFGKWWPHDDKKGWNPKSKRMAKAGFYYTPTDDSEDMVNCPYCLIGLDGWEPKDDPLEEHKSRTPTCPFFVGLHGSLPTSSTSSPVKSVLSEPTTTARSLRNSGVGVDDKPSTQTKTKTKRRMTQQNNAEEDEEIFTSVESPPSKRRKSTRGVSNSHPNIPSELSPEIVETLADEDVVKKNTPSKRKSKRVTTNPRPRKSTMDESRLVETIDENTSTPISNRRASRSAPTLSLTEETTFELTKEKTPVKPKGKQSRTNSRKLSALSKIVSEIDNASCRISRSSHSLEELPTESTQDNELDARPEIIEEETPLPKKKRGRPPKVREPGVDENKERPTPSRRTRQTIASELVDDIEIVELENPAKQLKALVIPKRKRASARATRTASAAVVELPEIEETEIETIPTTQTKLSGRTVAVPIVEIPEREVVESEPELEKVVPPAPRGKKAGRGRGRSTTVRNSIITNPPEDIPQKPARRGRASSKRDISAVYSDMTNVLSPPAKRKASGLRSIQKIPTPSEDSESDVFEDSKSTFSDMEDPPPREKPVRGGRRTLKGRSKILMSEEREIEEAPSTIYHSADDYLSSPTQSSIMGKSKREMVDKAKKELEEEIWREKVANGEIGVGGSSEDDEKENAAEEKGKKPTRTIRGKGAKGRKNKLNGKRGTGNKIAEISEADEVESIGESHALVVKAMISPLRPGPLIPAEGTSEESSFEQDDQMENGQVTPIRSPRRKVLNWTPAKIEAVSSLAVVNGNLAEEEEEMSVEQWMRWVINDEVNRLEEECEKLVRNLEKEGERARRLLENLA